MHLALLSPNEFYEIDAESGILRRRVRGPKSLRPHLVVLADDLLGAYTKGVTVCDTTVRINGRPYRHGDYCEFAFHVRRTMSGRAGSTAYRGVGLIKAFYSVNTGHASNPTSHTLVNIIELPAEMQSTGMHLLRLDEDGGSGGSDRMIHIDNIVFKLHRVPQPLEPGVEDDGGRFYCLRIWEAR